MKIGRSLLVGTAMALAGASAAQAGTKVMATGPGSRFYPNFSQTISCNILNANKTAKTVTIELMDYLGTVVATSGPVLLDPSKGLELADSVGNTSWCRFTVDGSTKKYRAAAVYSLSGTYVAASVAK